MTYFTAVILIGVILTLLLLAAAYKGLTGSGGITSVVTGQLLSISGNGCGSDSDCKGNGVCVSGKCICFDDSQCKVSCDKSIGTCK